MGLEEEGSKEQRWHVQRSCGSSVFRPFEEEQEDRDG